MGPAPHFDRITDPTAGPRGDYGATHGVRWGPRSAPYLTLNLVGATTLAVIAAHDRNWGFLILQASWALAAAWGLTRLGGESRAGR
jgi:hypothetical protein